MKNSITEYNLPDLFLSQKEEKGFHFKLWVPKEESIILGQSNNINEAVSENMMHSKIKIMKRPSGGESVLLTPNTLIISISYDPQKRLNSKVVFRSINDAIIFALKKLGIKNVFYKGISDITVNDMKILGCSIYRKNTKIFYHAVLNVAESPQKISDYLKHPSKEPDYRKGRSHKQFVTSLKLEGYRLSFSELKNAIRNQFIMSFEDVFEY